MSFRFMLWCSILIFLLCRLCRSFGLLSLLSSDANVVVARRCQHGKTYRLTNPEYVSSSAAINVADRPLARRCCYYYRKTIIEKYLHFLKLLLAPAIRIRLLTKSLLLLKLISQIRDGLLKHDGLTPGLAFAFRDDLGETLEALTNRFAALLLGLDVVLLLLLVCEASLVTRGAVKIHCCGVRSRRAMKVLM